MMKQAAVIQCTKRSNAVEAHERAAGAARFDPHHAADQIEDDQQASMPRMAMPPIQRSVTWWKCRQSRPAGCSIVQAFWSGSVQRPEIRPSSLSSLSSLTALAVGLTDCPDCAAGRRRAPRKRR